MHVARPFASVHIDGMIIIFRTASMLYFQFGLTLKCHSPYKHTLKDTWQKHRYKPSAAAVAYKVVPLLIISIQLAWLQIYFILILFSHANCPQPHRNGLTIQHTALRFSWYFTFELCLSYVLSGRTLCATSSLLLCTTTTTTTTNERKAKSAMVVGFIVIAREWNKCEASTSCVERSIVYIFLYLL